MESIAIQFKNAFKSYNSNGFILQNLQMTVKIGTIYGVLGASGCGKTTMLSCILGIHQLDSGTVYVKQGKTISYMPQEIGLYETFTIHEVLHYFGRINGMSKADVEKQIQIFMSLLDLSETSTRRIETMSSGQKRRVSLAVSMINTPSILILDEPTVGVDPMIRQNIWKYLCQLTVEKGTTIIITTHYVEEAKDCHMVGLMTNGRMLVEKAPKCLLQEHETEFLEEVFLKLSKISSSNCHKSHQFNGIKESNNTAFNGPVVILKYKSNSEDYQDLSLSPKIHKIKIFELGKELDKILTLVYRNFLLLWRLPMYIFNHNNHSSNETIIIHMIFSGDPVNTPFGIVNADVNSTFCSTVNSQEGLSCKFLDKISQNLFNLQHYSNVEEAILDVRSGSTLGYIMIPNNFPKSITERLFFGNFASNETLDGSQIGIKMDFSEYFKTVYIRKELYKLYLEFISETVSNMGGNSKNVEIPLKLSSVFLEGSNIEYLQHPLVMLMAFLTPMTVSWMYIYDKRSGILDRTSLAGVNYVHLVCSLFISELCLMFVQITLALVVEIVILGLKIKGSLILLFALTLMLAICGFSFGMLFGTIWDREIEVVYVILITYLPTLVSSGNTWPREGVNYWAKMILDCLPAALPIKANRAIAQRGLGISHVDVWLGFAVPCIWIVVNCCVIIIYRKIYAK